MNHFGAEGPSLEWKPLLQRPLFRLFFKGFYAQIYQLFSIQNRWFDLSVEDGKEEIFVKSWRRFLPDLLSTSF